MSIPKEPRQLMINIMYLVLTALLALNVSAEIFNAFDMVNKGLTSASNTLDESNSKLPELIKTGAKKKASLQTYADRIDAVTSLSDQGSTFIDAIVDTLIDLSCTPDGKVNDLDYVEIKGGKKELIGKKNYDAVTRVMVDEGRGEQLKERMKQVFLRY